MMKSIKPTESEFEVLQVLWAQGPSTVRSVNEVLCKKREVGYTTTLKIMQIMHEKGLLSREKSGKTHIYRAEITQSETQQALLDRFVKQTFNGSAMQMVMQALGNHQASPEEIDQIRAYLDQIENQQPE